MHPNYTLMNSISSQISQTHPQINLNILSNPQEPHHPTTEPFMLDTAFQEKAEIDESSAPIDKNLLKRLDRFDEFIKKSQGLNSMED